MYFIKTLIFSLILFFFVISPFIQYLFMFSFFNNDKTEFNKEFIWYLLMFIFPGILVSISLVFSSLLDVISLSTLVVLFKQPSKKLTLMVKDKKIKTKWTIGFILFFIGFFTSFYLLNPHFIIID